MYHDGESESMFDDLYNHISHLFWRRWPVADGEITSVYVVESQIVVEYKFSLGDDGPYTGEASWPTSVMNITEKLRVGQTVTVRYRKKNPSINALDKTIWDKLHI